MDFPNSKETKSICTNHEDTTSSYKKQLTVTSQVIDSGSSTSANKAHKSKRPSINNGALLTSPINSWIEQIQFKAQYNHYRSNNYASVVNSSSSLDKVVTVKVDQEDWTRVEPIASIKATVKDRERHNLCWNFPRVKLRQIFNVKSLDDILGRNHNQSNLNIKHKHKRGPKTSNASTSQVPWPASPSSNSQSHSHSSLSSASVGGAISYRPQILYQCEITPPSPKINISTSSSDNNFGASVNTFLTVPHQELGKRKSKHTHTGTSPRSHGLGRVVVVATTKSDNFINRIIVSPPNTYIGDADAVNCHKSAIKVPCCSSVNDLDVLESVYTSQSQKKNQKKLRFMNKVTPIYSPNDKNMAKISENQPKLVVTSISFLPRPTSPSPVSSQLPSPLDGSAAIVSAFHNGSVITPYVFNKLTSFDNGRIYKDKNGYNNAHKDNTKSDGLFKQPQRNGESFISRIGNNDSANSYLQQLQSRRPNRERINITDCCGFVSSGVRNPPQISQAQGRIFQSSKDDSSPTPVTFSSNCNNPTLDFLNKSRLIQRADLETDSDKYFKGKEVNKDQTNSDQKVMGDLQSPQYVKRTAHMFNSRYAATTSQNGSTVLDESRKITPSYINVSRSISGYTCLSYNGSGSNGYHGANGKTTTGKLGQSFQQPTSYQKLTTSNNSNSNGTKYPPEIGSNLHSSESDHSIKYKSTHRSAKYDGDADGPTPPPLPKTAPPIYNSSYLLTGRGLDTSQEDVRVVREKSSFILNRIERLCGSAEVMSSWRRTRVTTRQETPIKAETIIPITLEENDQADGVEIKSCPGKHNLLTDNDGANKKCTFAITIDRKIPHNTDNEDRENSNRAIPVHRNGNFKDWYDIGSNINLEETGESGLLLYENIKSIKIPIKSEDKTEVPGTVVSLVDFGKSSTSVEEEGEIDSDNMGLNQLLKTSKRLPLTDIKISPEYNKANITFGEQLTPQQLNTKIEKENEVQGAVVRSGSGSTFSPGEKNGDYFLLEMNEERSRLNTLIATATEELVKLDSSSEEAGKIRAAIGKANLLCSKKFKQFGELCQTNLEQSRRGVSSEEPFTTKNEDLAGFWDMVLIQVEQIHSMFEDLDPNHTPRPKPDVVDSAPSVPKTPVTRKLDSITRTSPASSASTTPKQSPDKPNSDSAKARDETRRRLLAEKRRAMKVAACGESTSEAIIQIFTPGSN